MAKQTKKNNDKMTSKILLAIYGIFLILSCFIIYKVIEIKFFWEPDPKTVKYFTPRTISEPIKPMRGSILDHNGKLLAISTPLYVIGMDATVLKEDFKRMEEGRAKEQKWRQKAKKLSEGLSRILKDKSASYYYKKIISSRDRGIRYFVIHDKVTHDTYMELKKLPLFNEGPYKGGICVDQKDNREYPYDNLAKRVIGHIKDLEDTNVRTKIGVEAAYDEVLKGKEGKVWKKITDNKGRIIDRDSVVVDVVNGCNVRTTIDINLQDIADRALRKQIKDDEKIEGGSVILMDVETGAIRTMVNLRKNRQGELAESYNMAIGMAGEPGSVFKSAVLMALLDDGNIKLSSTIPTNGGRLNNKVSVDEYIRRYERNTNRKEISVIDGFEMSSNYVFRKLVQDRWGSNPQEFIDILKTYHLHGDYNFEISGFQKPKFPDPKDKNWSPTDLISIAIGYTVTQTPLHIATFYNAIAAKGKLSKPSIVEAIEKDGKVVEEFKPTIINKRICSRETIDSLSFALENVIVEGTGKNLKNTKCKVAGKTGTARVVLSAGERSGSRDPYQDREGRRRYQATFVGYFPADNPKYTVLTTLYTVLSKETYYGGTLPAYTTAEIVDNVFSFSSKGNQYIKNGKMPEMKAQKIYIGDKYKVPDVKGLGLSDAIYSIENHGFKCEYNGIGHVKSQIPTPGTQAEPGSIIKLVLN